MRYLLLNSVDVAKSYHILLVEVTNVPIEVPTMIWFCENRSDYSETEIAISCIKAFPEFLDVIACDTAQYKYTWLADEIELYRDNIELYQTLLGA